MRSSNRSYRTVLAKVGVTGAAVAALAVVAAPAAFAAPGVSVSPSTGLGSEAVVTVSASGFGAGQSLYASQCSGDAAAGTLVCDVAGVAPFTADASGSGSTVLTVHSTFTGLDQAGNPVAVDCATVPDGCFVGVSNEDSQRATAPISFA